MSELVLETKGLCKQFQAPSGDALDVLRDIDFTVGRGETVSIVGMSGAGKTTFLHIVGLLDRPSAGSVRYFGRDLTGGRETELAAFRNKTIGFIFQMHYLLPEFTAIENAVMPLVIRGVPLTEAQERGMELFNAVGLVHRAEHKPGQLSGGEQQKVSLVRAFIGEPAIILADEPTGNLDKKNARLIAELFLKLNGERDTALVLVTHNEELAAMMSSRYRMDDGCMVRL